MLKKKVGWYALGALLIAMVAHAVTIIYNAQLVNESALAYNKTYVIDLQNVGIGSISAQAVYSSATVPSQTFQDGTQSTGSFTVVTIAALSSATASNNVTIANNAGTLGSSLILPGYVLSNGINWLTADVASNTAVSLAAALQTVPGLQVSLAPGSTVIYTTAPSYGTFYNSWAFLSSTPTALTVATPLFTGGQNNADVFLNGVKLKQAQQWNVGVSAAATATNIATAINANPTLNQIVKASASGAVVTATSTLAGLNAFALKTSTPAAITTSAAAMTGGKNPSFALNGQINIPGNVFTTALPLLYTSNGLSIGGLVNQTTYYAVPLTASSFATGTVALASTSVNAQAGAYLTFTSSTTQLVAHTGTLAPLAITGTPSFKWQASNDSTNWSDVAVASVTLTSYSNPAANMIWSFGYLGPRYLRLNVVAPTTGGLALGVTVIGTN